VNFYYFFKLCASWGSVINSTPRPLFPREGRPVPIAQLAGWAPGPVRMGAENLALTGIRSPDRPASSDRFTDCAIPAYHTPGRTPLNEPSVRRRGRYPHNTQQTQDTKKACPQWDSNSRSQKSSGCRPTPLPTRGPGLAHLSFILPCKPASTYPPINLKPSGS
jgi:hypothetical protein